MCLSTYIHRDFFIRIYSTCWHSWQYIYIYIYGLVHCFGTSRAPRNRIQIAVCFGFRFSFGLIAVRAVQFGRFCSALIRFRFFGLSRFCSGFVWNWCGLVWGWCGSGVGRGFGWVWFGVVVVWFWCGLIWFGPSFVLVSFSVLCDLRCGLDFVFSGLRWFGVGFGVGLLWIRSRFSSNSGNVYIWLLSAPFLIGFRFWASGLGIVGIWSWFACDYHEDYIVTGAFCSPFSVTSRGLHDKCSK